MKKVVSVAKTSVLLLLIAPTIVFAQNDGAELARGFVAAINDAILFPLIALMIGIAMVVFLYGAYEFIANADNDSAREKGKQHILWGTVGLFVMVSAMAILEIAANTFDLENELRNADPTTQGRRL